MKEKHLVLSGSGTLFPYFIGAVKRFEEEHVTFKSVTGTSGGSIIGCFLACGFTAKEIEQAVLSKSISSFMDYSINPLDRFGLLNGDKFYNYIKSILPKDIQKFSQTKIPFIAVTTNLSKEYNTDRVNYFTSKTHPDMDLALAVRASSSIPVLFKYVVIDNEVHIDGGVSDNFPLNAIPESETSDIIGIKMDTSFASQRKILPLKTEGFKFSTIKNILFSKIDYKFFNFIPVSFLNYILSILDTLMNTIEREHIKDLVHSNIINIKSDQSITTNMFNYSSSDIRLMIQKGYSEVDVWLKTNVI